MADNLERLHDAEFEMLVEFKKICEKHHIRYYLSGGTLLGAIRHGGFIPSFRVSEIIKSDKGRTTI